MMITLNGVAVTSANLDQITHTNAGPDETLASRFDVTRLFAVDHPGMTIEINDRTCCIVIDTTNVTPIAIVHTVAALIENAFDGLDPSEPKIVDDGYIITITVYAD